jgi:hypothetical protein
MDDVLDQYDGWPFPIYKSYPISGIDSDLHFPRKIVLPGVRAEHLPACPGG